MLLRDMQVPPFAIDRTGSVYRAPKRLRFRSLTYHTSCTCMHMQRQNINPPVCVQFENPGLSNDNPGLSTDKPGLSKLLRKTRIIDRETWIIY